MARGPNDADGPGRKAFALRLDAGVHAAIEHLAAAELRSVNAQIEVLLREALRARGLSPGRRGRRPADAAADTGGDEV
ncbi:MAG: toxin-antitoxin system HicB family antitoxin [Alphaproteobacteria bacterium]|nr:toxin-antitoxin system HicB family antitoxin [Alphaproteobacteria bacterium]